MEQKQYPNDLFNEMPLRNHVPIIDDQPTQGEIREALEDQGFNRILTTMLN